MDADLQAKLNQYKNMPQYKDYTDSELLDAAQKSLKDKNSICKSDIYLPLILVI